MAHAQPSRTLALFTDRDGQRQVITDYLTHLRNGVGHEGPGLLSFYGVSGVGKSSLRERGLADFRANLQRDISDNRPFAIAEVDLDSDSIRLDSPIPEILGRVRAALGKAGISTPLFDYLYLAWWEKENPGQPIRLRNDKGKMAGLLDVADLVANLAAVLGVSLPSVAVAKGLHTLFPRISDWLQRSRAQKRFKDDGSPAGWPQRERIERMPVMLALDLLSAIEHTPQTSVCLVIDGFERVQSRESKTDAQWAFATLIGEVLRCTDTLPAPDGKPLRGRIGFILFGREKLRWADLFSRERLRIDWMRQIKEHCELLGLSEDDARRFLLDKAAAWERGQGRAEVAALIERHVDAILHAAAEHLPDRPPSYLPYYLDLAVLLIRDNATVFTPDMLGETPSELERRFLRYLDQQHRRALQALSLALTFDRKVFEFLRSKGFISGYDTAQFAWLVGDHWSFVHPAGDRPGFHRFHRHMQESLIASLHTPEDTERAREIIDALLDRLTENMRFERPADFGREQQAAYLDATALLREHEANGLLDAQTAVRRALEVDAPFDSRQALSLRYPSLEWTKAIALRKLGLEYPDTLRARAKIASWTGESGDAKAALALYQALLPDQERVLGPDHPHTLATRHNLARWTGESGDAKAALALYQALLPDLQRVLGPDQPGTLRTRNNIAHCTGQSGDAKAALALYQALLPDQQRILGPDHPDTLTTRNNIAHCTGQSGDAQEALALYQALLPDRRRVLGPDQPDTLITRANIAAWTGESGDAKAALALYQALLPDQRRVLGPDHPDTLATRAHIAAWTGESGDAGAALALFEALLPDQQRVLGPNQPDTLTTRAHIARWTGESGDAQEALALYQALLPDRQRVLGPDHPDTLTTRAHIAHWTGKSGDARAALALFEALLPDQQRVLGPNQPDTLRIRYNIAAWTGLSGDAQEALKLFKALLPDMQRVLDPDHPNSIATKDWIAKLSDEAD